MDTISATVLTAGLKTAGIQEAEVNKQDLAHKPALKANSLLPIANQHVLTSGVSSAYRTCWEKQHTHGKSKRHSLVHRSVEDLKHNVSTNYVPRSLQ